MELKVISETANGAILHSELKPGYQLVYKNLIILMKDSAEFSKFEAFIKRTQAGCCARNCHLSKHYVFRLEGTQTFLSYNQEEIGELRDLLRTGELKIRTLEQIRYN